METEKPLDPQPMYTFEDLIELLENTEIRKDSGLGELYSSEEIANVAENIKTVSRYFDSTFVEYSSPELRRIIKSIPRDGGIRYFFEKIVKDRLNGGNVSDASRSETKRINISSMRHKLSETIA